MTSSENQRTFPGLRSRWTMFLEWRYAMPLQTSSMQRTRMRWLKRLFFQKRQRLLWRASSMTQ